MDNIIVAKLAVDDEVPYDLLLLADPSVEIINDYIYRGDCYVAYKDNNIVGAYVMMKTRPLTLELVNIAVDGAHQGKGIGKSLIFSAIEMARGQGVKVLDVGTGNSSISQLALYQKCGFRIVSIDRDFFKKHYKEDIVENGIECIDMLRLSMDL